VSIDTKEVKARKDAVSNAPCNGLEEWLRSLANRTVYDGHAPFLSDRQLAAGEVTLTADRFFLTVDPRAAIPLLAGLVRAPYLTNSSILNATRRSWAGEVPRTPCYVLTPVRKVSPKVQSFGTLAGNAAAARYIASTFSIGMSVSRIWLGASM
jgi:hypothetical protein